MKSGDFELCIVNGLEIPDTGEVQMRHGQVYQLALANHGKRRCEVTVTIDGKDVGIWRIPAGQTIILERPVDQEGRFTFFRLDSKEAKEAKVPTDGLAGQISTWFVPELPPAKNDIDVLAAAAPEPWTELAGGTALTGKSDQEFVSADDEFDSDFEQAETIELWLTCEPVPDAEFERVYAIFECPDCKKQSRVPAGMGRVRVKCPHCTCQFVRQA